MPDAIDRRTWALLALAVLGVVLLYARTLGYGFTAWDDTGYVTGDPALGPLSVHQIGVEFGRNVMGNYHPITMLSYALDIRLAGGKVASVMHGASLGWHVLNLVLAFLTVRTLLGRSLWAGLVALLFAWHPMRVESVAWISGRKDLVMFAFACLTLMAYAAYLRRRSFPLLALSVLAMAAACLSKATAVALVPVLVLVDVIAGRDLRTLRPWLGKLPFLVVAVWIGVVTIAAQQEGITYGSELRIPLMERLVLACGNLPIYFAQLTVPVGLSSFHPYPDGGRSLPSGMVLAALSVVPLAWAVLRTRSRPGVLFGAGFFVLTIALVLQLVTVGQAMRAERYTYLPAIGWAMIIIECIAWASRRLLSREQVMVPAVVYAVILWGVAWGRVPVWADEMSVWNDMVATAPRSPLGFANRSGTAYKQGRYEAALRDAETALRLDQGSSLARYNRGLSLLSLQRYEEGVQALEPFVGLPRADTDLYESMMYGFMRTGRFTESVAMADTLLQRIPDHPMALVRRGYSLARLGRMDEARQSIERAKGTGVEQAEAWYTSAFIHLLAGDTLAACADGRRSQEWPLTDSGAEQVRQNFLDRFCGEGK